jgi:hypothetical protein
MMDPETGQPLFQPVINPPKKTRGKKAADLNTDRHGTGASDVSESLYRNAINRRTRHEIAAKQMELVSNILFVSPTEQLIEVLLLRIRLNCAALSKSTTAAFHTSVNGA